MKSIFTAAQYAFTLVMYALGACLLAASIYPSAFLFIRIWDRCSPSTPTMKALLISAGAGFGYFLSGLTLCLMTVAFRYLLNLRLKEGSYKFFSAQAFKWAFMNSLLLIVKYTFMNFMKVTPLLPLYYRWMGAKVGKHVQINTTNVGDVSLLEIGDDAVLGGDAVLIGHLAEHGELKLKKTVVGKKATIGLGSVIMPGCRIGDRSLIAAHSVLPKNSEVPPDSIYAGTPAKFIRSVEKRPE